MMKLNIKKQKIWKTGSGSAVITIPSDFIKNGMIEIGKNYNFEIDLDSKEDAEDE